MRKIEYRAWDTAQIPNKMLTFEECLKHFRDCYDMGINPFEDKCLIWQQYIGINDKNKVKIFEGDIVKTDITYFITTENDIAHKIGTKVYSYGSNREDLLYDEYLVKYDINSLGYYPFSRPALGGFEWDSIDCEKVEVIGNLYEHPELLK